MKKHKTAFLALFSCILFISLQAVSVFTSQYFSEDLENGDFVKFGKAFDNTAKTNGSKRSHSYDGKRYEIDHENGVFVVSHLHPSNVESQNHMSASYVEGEITYINDTLSITLQSQYEHLYLVTLDSTKPFDVYSGNCTIKAVSKDVDGGIGKMYFSGIDNGHGNWTISSLPKGVDHKELYKAVHPQKTIAKFDLLQIENNGVVKTYNKTDILIIGANELRLKKQE